MEGTSGGRGLLVRIDFLIPLADLADDAGGVHSDDDLAEEIVDVSGGDRLAALGGLDANGLGGDRSEGQRSHRNLLFELGFHSTMDYMHARCQIANSRTHREDIFPKYPKARSRGATRKDGKAGKGRGSERRCRWEALFYTSGSEVFNSVGRREVIG